METPSAPVEWSDSNPEVVAHIFRQGEKYLDTQVQMALAADQRAMTVASIYAAIATAVMAGALTYWDKTGSVPILAAGLAGGISMLIGAGMCLWAARPINFYYPGNEPANWYDYRKATLTQNLGVESENYQHHIDVNATCLERNANALAWGSRVALAAPILALAVWGVTLTCPFSLGSTASDPEIPLQSSSDSSPRAPS